MDAGTVLRMMVKEASVRYVFLFLGGLGEWANRCTGRGVAGAPESEVRRLNELIEEKGVRFHAAIDRVFGFEEVVGAFEY